MSGASPILEMIRTERRRQHVRLTIAAVAGAVVTTAAVILLGLSGWFIAAAAIAGVAGTAAAQTFNYLMPSAIIRLLAILRTGGRYVERVAGHEAALKALALLRPQLFERLTAARPQSALALSSGEASARFIQDVDAVQTLFVRLSSPWATAAGCIVALALTALANPAAAVALGLAMGLNAFGSAVLARKLAEPAGRSAQTATGALKDRLASLEAVAPELKAYGLESWAVEECRRTAEPLDRSRTRLDLAAGWIAVWQTSVSAGAVVAVIVCAAGATAPMVALAGLAALTGMEAVAALTTALIQNGAARQALIRLDEAVAAPEATPYSAPVSATIHLAGSDFSPPRRMAIVGPSGSGKTTLVEQLIGLREAESGRMRLGDVDVVSIDPPSRRSAFAYAAQDVRLIDGTVRQNLLLAGPAADDDLWQVLEDAALADVVRTRPLGLDMPIGADGGLLSGGERRRLTLARAYLRDAPWLVLDEPTEGLDAATEERVLTALDRRLSARSQGLLMVSHRVAPTRLCGAVLKLRAADAEGGVSGPADDDQASPSASARSRSGCWTLTS